MCSIIALLLEDALQKQRMKQISDLHPKFAFFMQSIQVYILI